jgi:hypothetical protein
MSNTSNPSAGSATGTSTYQFGRTCTLLVSSKAGKGLDLSQLRIRFNVKKSGIMTPNVADIRVYNMDPVTANTIGVNKQYNQVTLQAGYVGNYGVIFKGNIKWTFQGRESATTTFLDMAAGDGDSAYNYAVVNQPVAAGSQPIDQLKLALNSMAGSGIGQNYIGDLPLNQLPRGKVMFGNARDIINNLAMSNNFRWSIQDGQVVFVSQNSYLPGTAVVLTSKTGMIGTPEQTITGITCKCLLNPKLKIHGRAQINNASVKAFKINFLEVGSEANTPVPLRADGTYYILVAEHIGDTRGQEWYTNLQLLDKPPSTNPLNNQGLGT